MLLVTAATSLEMDAFLSASSAGRDVHSLCTGVGPVEAALHLTHYLAATSQTITGVINFGVAGAYLGDGRGAGLLDICLADREILGDLGICIQEQVVALRGESLAIFDTFDLDSPLLQQVTTLLEGATIAVHRGTFVTVNCVSGTRRRGDSLARQHQALCENMEGAAVARVCRHFQLPLVELRCISNLVEDRDPTTWRLRDACRRCGQVVARVVEGLSHV